MENVVTIESKYTTEQKSKSKCFTFTYLLPLSFLRFLLLRLLRPLRGSTSTLWQRVGSGALHQFRAVHVHKMVRQRGIKVNRLQRVHLSRVSCCSRCAPSKRCAHLRQRELQRDRCGRSIVRRGAASANNSGEHHCGWREKTAVDLKPVRNLNIVYYIKYKYAKNSLIKFTEKDLLTASGGSSIAAHSAASAMHIPVSVRTPAKSGTRH